MVESNRNTTKGIIIMVISSICACVGQLLWKLSVERGVIVLLTGFLFYGIGALLMIYAYKFGKLSILQPVLSLNYVFSIFLGSAVLGETIELGKCVGVMIIILGVVLIAKGEEK